MDGKKFHSGIIDMGQRLTFDWNKRWTYLLKYLTSEQEKKKKNGGWMHLPFRCWCLSQISSFILYGLTLSWTESFLINVGWCRVLLPTLVGLLWLCSGLCCSCMACFYFNDVVLVDSSFAIGMRACSYAGQLIVLCVCCCHMLRGVWSISVSVGMLMSWSALAFIAWILLSPAGAIFFCCWCRSLGLHHAIIAAFCKYFCCLCFVLMALHLEHS